MTDFGLSKSEDLATHTSGATSRGGPAGTPVFMAPEMLEDNLFSEKADVYSFAITCWEVLTGERPFAGLKGPQIIMAVCMKGKRPPVPENCGLPAAVKAMQQCWSQAPDDRPTFAEIVASATDWAQTTRRESAAAASQPTRSAGPSSGGSGGSGGGTRDASEQNLSSSLSSNGITARISRTASSDGASQGNGFNHGFFQPPRFFCVELDLSQNYGWVIHGQSMVVQGVQSGSQAAIQGVQPGWTICR